MDEYEMLREKSIQQEIKNLKVKSIPYAPFMTIDGKKVTTIKPCSNNSYIEYNGTEEFDGAEFFYLKTTDSGTSCTDKIKILSLPRNCGKTAMANAKKSHLLEECSVEDMKDDSVNEFVERELRNAISTAIISCNTLDLAIKGRQGIGEAAFRAGTQRAIEAVEGLQMIVMSVKNDRWGETDSDVCDNLFESAYELFNKFLNDYELVFKEHLGDHWADHPLALPHSYYPSRMIATKTNPCTEIPEIDLDTFKKGNPYASSGDEDDVDDVDDVDGCR